MTGKILFTAHSPDGALCFWAINPDGSGKTEILPEILSIKDDYSTYLYHLTVSPDGKKLAFPKDGITIMNLNGSIEKKLTVPFPEVYQLENLRWSPDGKRIAFEGYNNKLGRDIYIVNIDNGDLTRLTENIDRNLPEWERFNQCPVWSPDSKRILFGNYCNDQWKTYLIRVDKRNQEQLVTGPDIIGRPEWSPDGERIAFYGPGAELYVGVLEGTEIKQVRKLTHGCKAYYKRWFPDGTKIVFSDDASKMCIINADGNNLKEVCYGWLLEWVADSSLENER